MQGEEQASGRDEEFFAFCAPRFHRPGAAQYAQLTERLCRSFAEYPEFRYTDSRFLDFLFYLIVGFHSRAPGARVYSLSPQLEEAALWHVSSDFSSPYGSGGIAARIPGLPFRFLRSLPLQLKRANREIFRENRRVDARIRRLGLPKRFVKLEILMVVPERRGEGRGRALLLPVLELASEAELPVVLVTHTPGNRAMYERYGFVTADVEEGAAGSSSAIMVRPPGEVPGKGPTEVPIEMPIEDPGA